MDPMELKDVLQPSAVLAGLRVDDKKSLLSELSETAARLTGMKPRDIFHALEQRERLGSTGLGRGIAIPHGRMPAARQITCLFARLEKPIAYDSLDGEPVDLVILLLTPEQAGADHLKALAKISRLMRDTATVEMLRATRDRATLHAILTDQGVEPVFSKTG
jgi:nitrogen PTS system EIIA component